jgi:hypothetical protein
MRDWLSSQLEGRLAYITLTYKKRRDGDGGIVYLTREIMESQTKWLLIRLDRTVFGRRKTRKLERIVFHEGDGFIKRRHTHFVIRVPAGWTSDQLITQISSLWRPSDWGRPLVHKSDCKRYIGSIRYSTKEGADAFDPSASEFGLMPNQSVTRD